MSEIKLEDGGIYVVPHLTVVHAVELSPEQIERRKKSVPGDVAFAMGVLDRPDTSYSYSRDGKLCVWVGDGQGGETANDDMGQITKKVDAGLSISTDGIVHTLGPVQSGIFSIEYTDTGFIATRVDSGVEVYDGRVVDARGKPELGFHLMGNLTPAL